MRAVRRTLRIGLTLLAALLSIRAVWTVVVRLTRNRPQRIGNWFRDPSPQHREVYRDERRCAIERQRAEEEGWRVAQESRADRERIVVDYERFEPALGSEGPDKNS